MSELESRVEYPMTPAPAGTAPDHRVVQVRLPDSGRIYSYKAPLSRVLRPGLSAVRVRTPRGLEVGSVVGFLDPDDVPAGRELKWVEP